MSQQFIGAGGRIIPILALVLALGSLRAVAQEASGSPFSVGGYGELHANFVEGAGKDKFDIHRFVLYMGYEFADWIQLHSETEIEHAFVNDGHGEVAIEQLYLDFALSEPVSVRAGRVLTPIGIINQRHEPSTFYGVERPQVDTVIIPSTWSSDGIGVYGKLGENLSYEAYVVNGLDGSKFNALSGIRGGRMKEQPSLNQVAVTGRVDIRPLPSRDLRVGVSGYTGGANNGNRGTNPGVNASLTVLSADAEYRVGPLDFRGVYAEDRVHGAAGLGNGTAAKMKGWYVEGGWHFLPESVKQGRLAEADAVLFTRYEKYDTQAEMPAGVAKNLAGDRRDLTVGLAFYPVANLVTKADYQLRKDAAGTESTLINFGIGWMF
ncbi:MAG: hypothetical protein BWY76_01002 [bacterium ADurb.Bin429]|nr:MAG: hypothetical protein BWY76_01002 [bacterium ADurb.Bin429]